MAAPPERVWTALLITFTDFGIPIKDVIRADYFIRSDPMQLPAETVFQNNNANYYFDCGTQDGEQIARYLHLLVDVTTLLRASGDSTAVRIGIQARGTYSGLFTNQTAVYQCVSRGTMEVALISVVRMRLAP